MKKTIIILLVLAVAGLAYYFIHSWNAKKLINNPDFACGNGRIEATEINVAARLAGKVEYVKVQEGDRVEEGQPLVVMQTNVLVADLYKAEAKRAQAIAAKASAEAQVAVQEATLKRMEADYEITKADAENAKSNYDRYKTLWSQKATTEQLYEKADTRWKSAQSSLLSADAKIKEAEASLSTAKAELEGAKANILAAEAEIARIKADISDSVLRAPLKGRIQYRVAEPGEVLSAGGRAINMIDLTDVYITFFLPEKTAGKVKVGTEVRIVLDAAPDYPLPAKVTYVANVAQFTPKTVETQVERQKLMFRVKARIDRELLEDYIHLVKTGLPGVAWVKLNPKAEWPKELQISEKAKKRAQEMRAYVQQQQKQSPADLSETEKRNANPFLDVEALQEEAKRASDAAVAEVITKGAKQADAVQKADTEKVAQQSKSADQKKEPARDKVVEAAKQVNAPKVQPKVEQPKVEQPKVEQPKAEQPKAAAPAAGGEKK